MSSIHPSLRSRSLLALVALVLASLAFAAATSSAGATGQSGKHPSEQRLVVRGDATIVDAPCDPSGCPLEYTGGAFRGTIGTGAYGGSFKLKVAETFPNGEGGVCAPIKGRMVLGEGSPDRLVLAVYGDSCQDGQGDVRTSSFTGLAQFVVKYGTGKYARTEGSGLASFSEDAADHDRMTLIGRISG